MAPLWVEFHLLQYLGESSILLSSPSYEQRSNGNSLCRKSLSGCSSTWIMNLLDGQDGCMIFCLPIIHHHRDKVVDIFTRAMHILRYQPSSIISWGRSYQTANIQKATGDEFYQFFHMTSAQGLLGIMKTGLILPSATDRMGLPENFPILLFA